WHTRRSRANGVPAPPVLPYWWSLAVRLFEERPFLWKLWLWPFSLLLVVALHDLFRRFASRGPLFWMSLVVFSPAFLPGYNLMLDVPAQALALTALSLFVASVDRRSFLRAALAGIVAGLAMETKYTAFLVPPAMFLYVITQRGVLLGLVRWLLAAGLAVGLFVAWEWHMHQLYGRSHFLQNLGDGPTLLQRLEIAPFACSLLGSVGPVLFLLMLAALRWHWFLLGLGLCSVIACLGLLAACDIHLQT